MTYTDKRILFTALAFLAVVIKGKESSAAEAAAEQVRQVAELIEAYCMGNVANVSGAVSEYTEASEIDQLIEAYVIELRDDEAARLPDSKQALVKMHDRLHYRKARRIRREFYASATEAVLADLVLALLDEEIADESKTRVA